MMAVIYVSHPFSGNESENRLLARKKIAELTKKYSDMVFINPLDNMMYAEEAELDYDTILLQCIRLLDVCDGVIMLGDWRKSRGCLKEYKYAVNIDLPVYDHELKVLNF